MTKMAPCERGHTHGFLCLHADKQRNGTLYIGMTDDLVRRIYEHREQLRDGFSKTYDVRTLAWFEQHPSRESAFARERQMKKWNRAWKLRAIEKDNPDWRDLWEEIAI